MIKELILGLVAACLLSQPICAAASFPSPTKDGEEDAAARPHYFGLPPSEAAERMVEWVKHSKDNGALPFVIVDKPAAKAFVFDVDGKLLGGAWVLLGLAEGDADSIPGIGTMPLSAITPEMRVTPAGRFVAFLGLGLDKPNVLWVDYPNAISMHRVITGKPAERRLQRIKSPVPAEHRISYGCINVPAPFFDNVVEPTFRSTKGVVYILPDKKPMREVFSAYYEVNPQAQLQTATETVGSANATPEAEAVGSLEGHDLTGVVY